MRNQYRVDVADSKVTPCGMNSLLYLGENVAKAQRAFNLAKGGRDAWGQLNPNYGVILSVWNGKEYEVTQSKGLDKNEQQT